MKSTFSFDTLTEQKIPYIFIFHRINETITTPAQMTDVLTHILTLKRDEEVLTYLAFSI